MSGVFVNYRSADNPLGAAAIHDALTKRFGAQHVFRDCVSLRAGEHYPSTIREALKKSDVLVAVIGPDWLTLTEVDSTVRLIDRATDWVRREIEWAIEWRIPVVPVLLKGTPRDARLPHASELPGDLRPLAFLQVHEVHQRRLGADMARLAARLIELAPALGANHTPSSAGFYRLVDALEAVPCVAHDDSRALLIAELRPAIGSAVRHSPRRREHVVGILRACLDHDGGAEELLGLIRNLEPGDNISVRRLMAVAAEVLPDTRT